MRGDCALVFESLDIFDQLLFFSAKLFFCIEENFMVSPLILRMRVSKKRSSSIVSSGLVSLLFRKFGLYIGRAYFSFSSSIILLISLGVGVLFNP